jgi:hypothetical protein
MTFHAEARGPDALDDFLVVVFLLGIYLGIDVHLSPTVPIPTVVSGAAGMVLLAKQMQYFEERHVRSLFLVILLYLGSILSATDYGFLHKRFTGLVQLTYSLVICYAFFVTLLRYGRTRLARIFLVFSLVILAGCALENYVPAFRSLSDAVRERIFSFGVYDADLRDLILYGRIRPKLFTSEPSAVTFNFALFAFAWYVLSTARWKAVAYGAMFAAAFVLMRGPTLLLGLALAIPYEVLLAARQTTAEAVSYNLPRIAAAVGLSVLVGLVGLHLANTLYAERIADIESGLDPSFFSRVIAPPLVAFDTMSRYPIAGAGLTGEEFIGDRVRQIYSQAPSLASVWHFDNAAHALTNYFWTHWIYLGAVWGAILLVALTGFLRALGATSIAFCWTAWIVFGQASGAYVGPKTWVVFFLVCASTILHERERAGSRILVRLTPSEAIAAEPTLDLR